jgi:hypothetical protein
MPRSPRILLSHSDYRVMTRGNNKMHVFHEADDYQWYAEREKVSRKIKSRIIR